jgi:hypothetical protein
MNIIFLSPHFPPHYFRFCRELKTAGANVLGIGDSAYNQLAAEVRQSLTEYYRITDLHDYDGLLRACGFFTHKYGKLDRIDSLNEYWLETEARIRDDFNIFGVGTREIDSIRRKSRMKAIFRQAGLKVAQGRVVHTREQALELIKETGYPVVAKPDDGVGALATYRLGSPKDLDHFLANKPGRDYIVEAFVAGKIFSFDGLADREGQPLFYTAHAFSQGIMETVNQNRHLFYYTLRDIPAALESAGRRCLKAFEVRERFFHIEFFETAPDEYTALEVNMRPPGGYTTDMFNYAHDIDIYRIWAQLLVHNQSHVDYQRKYHCCYASRKNHLAYANSHEQVMRRCGSAILTVKHVPGVFSSALGDLGYLLRTPSFDEMMEIVSFIHQLED